LPGFFSFQPSAAARRLRTGAAFLAPLALGGCSGGILDPKGPIGAADTLIMFNSLEIMLAIVIPTIIAAFGMAWWYRSSNARALYRPGWDYSGRLELIVLSIPILVVLLISGVIWIGSHELDPSEPIKSSEKPHQQHPGIGFRNPHRDPDRRRLALDYVQPQPQHDADGSDDAHAELNRALPRLPWRCTIDQRLIDYR
jgi:heme/copper-type cytochrome/quinol oxidase subunit 2